MVGKKPSEIKEFLTSKTPKKNKKGNELMVEAKFKEGDEVIAVYSCSGAVHKVPAVVVEVIPPAADGDSYAVYRLNTTVRGHTYHAGSFCECMVFDNQRDADIAELQTRIEIERCHQAEHRRKMRKCGQRVAALQDKLYKLIKG